MGSMGRGDDGWTLTRAVGTRAVGTLTAGALALGALTCLVPACGLLGGESPAPTSTLSLPFAQASRRWIGPELEACRLQDWRLDRGRVVCEETAQRFPLRTAILGGASMRPVAEGKLALRASLRTGVAGGGALPDGGVFPGGGGLPSGGGAPAGADGSALPDATQGWRGLVLGAGRPGDDPRLATLVHHRPARDGGLLAVVDSWGRPALFDNGVDASARGSWSVGGALAAGELPRLEAQVRGPAFGLPWLPHDPEALAPQGGDLFTAGGSGGDARGRPGAAASDAPPVVSLQIEVWREAASWRLELLSRDEASGAALGRATLRGLSDDRVLGAPGLVSHLAPASGGHFWFDDLTLTGEGLEARRPEPGAVRFVQYTLSDELLTVTAQFAPLGPDDDMSALLQRVVARDQREPLGEAAIDPDAWTATFRVPGWDGALPQQLVVTHALADGVWRVPSHYELTVAGAPAPGRPLRVASLNCTKHYTGGLQWNSDALWFPHADTAAGVAAAEPDLLVFAGDQLYEGDLDPVDARDEDTLILDYLTKWFRFGSSFGALTRVHPTITIPDDHDVYHGNLWGAGGRAAVADSARGLSAQDAGGYKFGPRFVNVVHRTQTSHLPPPVDPAPVEQGISVYFTELRWGGMSVAVVGDRQWKSSASVVVPEGRVVNGWFTAEGFDPHDADVPGAQLLGRRQEAFLQRWAEDWSGGVWTKLLVSQSPFVNVATLPEEAGSGSVLPSLPVPEPGDYPEGYRFAADTDSGGWPQSPRDRAVRALTRGLAVHLAGDQHLGTLVEYGVDAHRDGGFAFTSPAIANTWPRRWWPPVWGQRREPDAPHYTGDFADGFGNLLTVWAAANPVQRGLEPAALHDRAPGFGLVDLDPDTRTITFHCWPRGALPSAERGHEAGLAPGPRAGAADTSEAGEERPADSLPQYQGWPRSIHQLDNGPEAAGWLEVTVPGCDDPVFSVLHASGEVLYTWRAPGRSARLPVPHHGPWSLRVWDEARDLTLTSMNLRADDPLHVIELAQR